MLACIVNKGICSERMVRRCVAAGCTKSYSIMFRFPKIHKLRRVGIANTEDNCRDVCVVRATTTECDACY